MPYTWDEARARYRDSKTGRFVKTDQVVALSSASIEETSTIAAKLAATKTGKAFEEILREEIKKETIRQYILGRGGVNRMTPKDWGSVGGSVREQYKHLSGFVADLENLTEPEIISRIGMYIGSSREGFEKGKLASVTASGNFTEERWVLAPDKENCDDCKALAAKGWVKIGTLGQVPGDGGTKCLTHCGCTIQYR